MRFPPLLLLLAAALPAAAADLHVAPSGSNSTGDGSLGNPYRTLTHALTRALPGDRLVLRQGTYVEDPKVTVPDVTVRSMDGEQAVISLPVDDPLLLQPLWIDAPGVRVERLELVGGYNYALKIDGDGARVEDTVAHGAGTVVVSIGRQADDVQLRRVEVHTSGLRDPAVADGIRALDADRMLVQDCHVHDVAGDGVETRGGSRDVVIERTRVARCGGRGILLGYRTADADMDPATNPDWDETTDAVVRNCTVEDAAGAGIALYASRRPRIANCTLERVAAAADGGILGERVLHAGVDRINVGARLFNLVVTGAPGSDRRLVQLRTGSTELPLASGTNRWFDPDAPAEFEDAAVAYDLAGWAAHVQGETGSSEGDPLVAGGRLLAGSPCVDAGTDAEAPADDLDLDPRPLDGDGDSVPRADIGADELVPPPPLELLRGDFARLDPLQPARALVFPLATVIVPGFASGGSDPTANILSGGPPLAVYEVRPAAGVLHARKDAAGDTVVVELR